MAATATATTAAPNASQRSCWRSVPRARRKRTTSDQAPTGIPSTVTTRPTPLATPNGSVREATASGFGTAPKGAPKGLSPNGSGIAVTRPTAAAAAATLAHQRQRRDGKDPVGVSNRTKPSSAASAKPKPLVYTAA
jgi:hypothetical protein